MPRQNIVSKDDLIASVVTGLRTAAVRPNVLGYVPHAKQEKFHRYSKKGRLYIGGNRSGKTTAGVVEGIWRLTGKHPWAKPPFIATPERPIRGRVVGVDYPNGIEKILLPEYARWCPQSELYGGTWEKAYQAKLRVLRFKNGSTVEFMSYDQDVDKFAGTSRDFTHFDEEPPEAIYNECIARLIDTGGPWWLTMTPVEGMTWIYDRIYLPGTEGKVDHIAVIEAHMKENPHLNQNEVELYLSSIDDPQERRARGEGKFVQLGGLVFKTFDPTIHVKDPDSPGYIPLDELKKSDWKWYCSLDHGFNNPTAVLWHAVHYSNRVVTFDEHYQDQWTIDQHSEAIKKKIIEHGRAPDIFVCDPALRQKNGITGTSAQFEYNKLGLPFMLGNNDVNLGISRINQYLREIDGNPPHWTIYQNCPNLIREMARLRWKTYTSKKVASQNNRQDAIHKKDDHAPDSARYFFTMLPDLAPDKEDEKKKNEWRQQFSGSPNGANAWSPRVDENLVRERRNRNNPARTEWTAVDDSIGYF